MGLAGCYKIPPGQTKLLLPVEPVISDVGNDAWSNKLPEHALRGSGARVARLIQRVMSCGTGS